MKKIIIVLVLAVVLTLAMPAAVMADKPDPDTGHNHGGGDNGGGGKDWHQWCHDHWVMGHTDHASWQKQCVDKTGWFESNAVYPDGHIAH